MREMKDSGIEWIGEIPADWAKTRIGNLFRFSSGDSLTNEEIQDEGLYKVYGANGPRGYYHHTNIAGKHILIGRVGALCGNIHVVDEPVWVTEHALIAEQISPGVLTDFAARVFESMNLGQYSKASAQPVIASSVVQRLQIPIPPSLEQRRIADYLDRKCSQIDAIIARQQEVIEKLKAYKLAVITEAVTKGLNPDVPMKDSGVEWIGEIPEHWEIRRIGSFARVTSSKRIFEGSYVDEGVPFYRSKEITDLSKGLHVQTEIFIPEEVFEQVNEASPAPKCGDILLTSIGTIGNTWISDGRKFYYKDGNITQIEANDSFDSAYVEYCFSSNVVLEQYTRLAMGSTLLALTIIKIKKILVAFPPLDEQRKIVQYLKLKCSSIDAAIKNKENLITKLVDYKKSLIYEVVTGKKEV